MTARDRFLATLRDGREGVAPRLERAVPDEIIADWRAEGLGSDEPLEHFHLDRWETASGAPAGFDLGARGFVGTVAEPADVPRWLAAHRPEGRFAADWPRRATLLARRDWPYGVQVFRGLFLTFGVADADSFTRFLYFAADYPELIRRMLEHLADLVDELLAELCATVEPDYLLLGEPIASSRHCVIGPVSFDRWLAPYYRRMAAAAARHRIPLLIWESYGRATPLLDEVLACGVNAVWLGHAAEAGVDYAELRRRYPELALLGGLDARTLRAEPAFLEQEVDRRCAALLPAGRWVPMLDDRVRPGLHYAAFRRYRDRLNGYLMP